MSFPLIITGYKGAFCANCPLKHPMGRGERGYECRLFGIVYSEKDSGLRGNTKYFRNPKCLRMEHANKESK